MPLKDFLNGSTPQKRENKLSSLTRLLRKRYMVYSVLALLNEEIYGNVPKAIKLYQRAIKICRDNGSKYDEITVLLELAPCYLKIGGKDEALGCFERASKLANEIDDKQAQERIWIESQIVNADVIISSDVEFHHLEETNESGEDE